MRARYTKPCRTKKYISRENVRFCCMSREVLICSRNVKGWCATPSFFAYTLAFVQSSNHDSRAGIQNSDDIFALKRSWERDTSSRRLSSSFPHS